MKRISDKEIYELLGYINKPTRTIAQVQLESCEKEVRGVFEEIENEMFDIYGGILKCREGTWEKAYKDWQVLKQKRGVK